MTPSSVIPAKLVLDRDLGVGIQYDVIPAQAGIQKIDSDSQAGMTDETKCLSE